MAKYVKIRVFENPLPGIDPRIVKLKVGAPLVEAVKDCRAPMVCIVNGIPLKRDYWMRRKVYRKDLVEFHPVFLGGGGGGSRSILGAIASIALVIAAPYIVGAFNSAALGTAGALTNLGRLVAAGIVLLGNTLISAVINPGGGRNGRDPDKASSIYDVDTQGNQAKIFSPIPVQYGRMKAYPDYASQPYVRYRTDINKDGDQYYYALFCLGQGEFEVEAITIADANIYSFRDVLVANILKPGQRPTHVHPCVVTCEAVSGQSLDNGNYVGGFPVCGPGRRTNKISLDIVFPQGLCTIDNEGKAKGRSIYIVAEIARLDDAGRQVGGWTVAFSRNISAASLTPQRRTFDIRVPTGRYLLRMRRHGARNTDDNRAMESCAWQSLRSELVEAAPLCKTATHFELVMRASEQLSSLSQRKIAILCTRKIRDWNGNLVPSRSPLLALRDKWSDPVYGDGLPNSRIDYANLRRLDAIATQRGDKFDYRFEGRVTSQEADQLIARVIRSVVLQRQGVKTIVRDGLAELPITLFSPTNTAEGSVSIDYIQVTEETADGVILEFFNANTWDWDEVECPAPGFTVSNTSNPEYNPTLPVMNNPCRIRMEGVVERMHALREGLYLAYTNSLRRQFITWSTELQGALVYYGAPVLFSSTLYNSDGGGEVIDYRESDDAFRLSGDVTSFAKLVFMFPNGNVTAPQSVRVLGDGWVIIDGPGVPASWGNYADERTRYVSLTGEMSRHIVKITSVQPKGIGETGAPKYELKGVIDVPEVHKVDEKYLPTPGTGPVAPTPVQTVTMGGVLYSFTKAATWPSSGYPASLIFYPDGRQRMRYYQGGMQESSRIVISPSGLLYTIQDYWVTNAQSNTGSAYEIAIAVSAGMLEGTALTEFERYLWLNEQAPRDNLILQGTKMRRAVTNESDTSTRLLVSQAGSNVYVSEWQSLVNEVEFRSLWQGFSSYVDEGQLKDLNLKQLSGYIGIRDKSTKTLQASVAFTMGMMD